MALPRHPLLLIVIDGWGLAPASEHNAIHLSGAPHMTRLAREYPSAQLSASGPAVGLPAGQMGNSEVGHLNIGAGRIVDQDFVRINKAVEQHALSKNRILEDLFDHCRSKKSALHVLGLLGPGGVHSHERHLYGVLEAAHEAKLPRVWVHHFLDGRDTPPKSALNFVGVASEKIGSAGSGRVATLSGRYWSMDRDQRWDRTQRAYRMLTELEGHRSPNAREGVSAAYARGETDEFVAPTIIGSPDPIRPGDGVLVYNFRPDRVRQLVRSLADPSFKEFPVKPLGLRVVTMTQYDRTFDALGIRVAFPTAALSDTLGEVYAKLGLRQLRIAETEKYAHVTYFFSGGREHPFPREDRILIPSAKVATYDLKPEMSAVEITEALFAKLKEARYDLVVLNFANPDMVGHTGKLDPTIRACQTTDDCIGRIAEFAAANDYVLAITADHGNAEAMIDAHGQPLTAHTTNPVPFVLVHETVRDLRLGPGGLSSVAPTLLRVVGVEVPREMTAPPLQMVGSTPGPVPARRSH